jgi:hypothetical protein
VNTKKQFDIAAHEAAQLYFIKHSQSASVGDEKWRLESGLICNRILT